MATKFQDLDDFFDAALELPIGGKIYRIPSPTAEVGLYVQRIMEAAAWINDGQLPPGEAPKLKLDDDEEVDLYEMVMGPALAEMHADKVAWSKIMLAAQTAFIWIGAGDAAAEAFWTSGGDPKAVSIQANNRAERRAQESKRTGAESTTQRPESMNGTTRPRRRGKKRGSQV